MRTTYQAQVNQFAKAVSLPSLQPLAFARDFRLPACLCKLIQQFFGSFVICIQDDVHFLIGRHTFLIGRYTLATYILMGNAHRATYIPFRFV